MTTFVLTRRYLDDYARNPVNLLLLAIVPAVFVVAVAVSQADAANVLGGTGGVAVETATAGWAAAFLAGIGMYFQIAATRDTDRRLVTAGVPAGRLVGARLMTGLVLAGLASTTALVALAARSGIDHPGRAVLGTLMFAVIYVAIGAVVGTIARKPVNGTVIVLFVWILDVFLGPAMGSADRLATRFFPTHFVTLWMVDLPSRHGGQFGDLGWALLWTVIAAGGAWMITAGRTRTKPTTRHVAPMSQLRAALRATWLDGRRNPAQWVLFVVVPLIFILAAEAVTPNKPITVFLDENGRQAAKTLPMPDLHGATMAPIAIASLAALIGLFVLLDSRAADRRAVLAGLRPRAMFLARLTVLSGTVAVAATVSLVTTALVFHASRWPTYIGANLLIGLTYALIGALLAPTFGRVGGVFIAFLLPFIDLGIVQSPMLHATPTSLARFLPGYGGSRVLLDGALTSGFDQTTPLIIALSWVLVLLATVALVYRRAVSPAPNHR
jgi:hypothetical protein